MVAGVCSPRAGKDRRRRILRRGGRRCWRPAARTPGTRGAPVLGRRRGGAEEVQRDVAEPPVASSCPEERRPRQIGDGGAAELAPMAAAVFCRGGARQGGARRG
jgi:hypothetical protein